MGLVVVFAVVLVIAKVIDHLRPRSMDLAFYDPDTGRVTIRRCPVKGGR